MSERLKGVANSISDIPIIANLRTKACAQIHSFSFYVPLDEDAQAFMQSRVDDYYASFTTAVSRGRGVPIAQVREGMGQGRVLGADAAQAQNMVDGVATFDDVIRKMRRDAKASARPKVSRLAYAQRAIEIL